MSARIAYFRVSTKDQSIAAQRSALGGEFDKEFSDEGVSGAVCAADRSGFAALLIYVREGDTVLVYAVDRLGRDSIDVQITVRKLMDKGVNVHVHGLGLIAGETGKLLLTLLAQFAEMERAKIKERCESGRVVARERLAATGKTQHGKESLGRPRAANPADVRAWRGEGAEMKSISATAKQFGMSASTVKRYCAEQSGQL